MKTLKSFLETEMDRLINLQQHPDGTQYLPSGFKSLDIAINGFQPKQLYLLASKPEVGKTALLLNILMHITLRIPKPARALFISPDVSGSEVAQRILSSYSSVEMSKIFEGVLEPQVLEKLYVKADQLKDLSNNLLIEDYPVCSIPQIRTLLEQLEEKPAILVIDNFSRLTLPDIFDEQTASTILMEQLKQLAVDFAIPVLVSAEIHLGDDELSIQLPSLRSLRENNIMVHVVDVVLFLIRPEYYEINNADDLNDDDDDDDDDSDSEEDKEIIPIGFGEAHLRIALNRFGPLDTVRLRCDLARQLFYETAQ
jgi:replicative DNA helicase